jgi:citrate lyase beta subunit
MDAPLRRSLLYVPGSSERMIGKAGGLGADVLILDLEDGVHPDKKVEARQLVARLLEAVDFGRAGVLVRANPPSSPWGQKDLEMLVEGGVHLDGVVLPKVEEPESVRSVDERLGEAVPLFLMIETARGVLQAASLAGSSPRVAGLIFGAADYRESLRAGRHPEEQELFFARSQIVHAARAADLDAFDTPWFEYRDTLGLEKSARRARELGFDGKTAIHPGQVDSINRVFSPTPSDVERARNIVAAMEEALDKGHAVATLGGEMIEALHLTEARRTLARARALKRQA